MSSIWQRIRLVVSSNLNSIISKAEDPEKILEQLIVEMRKQFEEAKRQVAVSIADEKRLERQWGEEVKHGRDWEQKAILAVRAGNDDLARKALVRKKEHEDRGRDFEQQYQQQKQAADALRNALSQLNEKIEEAKRKKNLLIARAKRAEAQKKIHNTMAGLGDSGAFDTFDRMAEKVEQREAEAAASVELTAHLSGDTLDQQFKQLQAASAGDDLLVELKQRLALSAPKAAPAEPVDELDADFMRLKALVAGNAEPIDVVAETEAEETLPKT